MTVKHIGFAGRKEERFRFPNDSREIQLEISAELAEALLDAANSHPDASKSDSPIAEFEAVMVEVLQ